MRLSPLCRLHHRRGRHILIDYSAAAVALDVNESFARLWQEFQGKDFTAEDISRFLCDAYGLDPAESAVQADSIIELWQKQKLLIP